MSRTTIHAWAVVGTGSTRSCWGLRKNIFSLFNTTSITINTNTAIVCATAAVVPKKKYSHFIDFPKCCHCFVCARLIRGGFDAIATVWSGNYENFATHLTTMWHFCWMLCTTLETFNANDMQFNANGMSSAHSAIIIRLNRISHGASLQPTFKWV